MRANQQCLEYKTRQTSLNAQGRLQVRAVVACAHRAAAAVATRHRPPTVRAPPPLPPTAGPRNQWMLVACAAAGKGISSSTGGSEEDDSDDGGDESGADGMSSSSSSGAGGPSQQQQRPLRIERLLANLGYGNRREATALIKRGRVTLAATGAALRVGDKALAGDVRLDDEPLDAPPPLTIVLHKPVGYVVTSPDDERVTDPTIYDLLPARYGQRRPLLAAVGRLDKATSGLLVMTDDGQLSHRIKSPARRIWKVYIATLDAPLLGRDAAAAARRFASGTMLLDGDRVPLLPAALRVAPDSDGLTAEVALAEGRYHQVRRMFAAVGREVVALHRASVGGLALGALAEGEWRALGADDLAAVFSGPDLAPLAGSGGGGGGGGAAAVEVAASSSSSNSGVEDEDDEGEGDEGEGEDERPGGRQRRRRPSPQLQRRLAAREPAADEVQAAKRYRDSTRWRRRRAALKQEVEDGVL